MSAPERMQQQFSRYDWSRAHRAEIQVRYGDMDMMGHLNNAVYVQYLELARVTLWSDMKVNGEQGYTADDRTVIARLELDYGQEIRYGQRVEVLTLVERIGTTSWTLAVCITADGQPCAFARTVQVAVDEHLKPRPVPQNYLAVLGSLLVTESGATDAG